MWAGSPWRCARIRGRCGRCYGGPGDRFPSGAFSLGVQDRQEHPQPASLIDLLSPAFAADPVGQEQACPVGVGWCGGLAHVADPEVFVRDHIVRADRAEGGSVRVVEALTTHLAVQFGDFLHSALVVGGTVLGLAAREPGQGLLRGFEFRGCLTPVARIGDEIAPESARKFAMPRSMPTTLPIAGSGSGWSCSTLSTTTHRRPSRLTETVSMCPSGASRRPLTLWISHYCVGLLRPRASQRPRATWRLPGRCRPGSTV